MGRRRQSREMAFKMLFQVDMGQLKVNEVVSYFTSGQKASPEVLEYAETLTRGVISDLDQIDRLITKQTHNWEFNRIAGVDRNILRMAVYELQHCPEVPGNVIMNEAIEMAKKYSTEDSGGFINGILDKLKIRPPEA
jgi:N utilization substance protein B